MKSAARNSTSVPPMGKLQNNVAMPYDFSIGDVIGEAWQRVGGAKKTYWGALAYYVLFTLGLFVVSTIVAVILGHFFGGSQAPIMQTLFLIEAIIFYAILLPLVVGFYYLGVRRSIDLPIRSKQIFGAYRFYWRLIGLVVSIFLISFVILSLGFFLIGIVKMAMPNGPILVFSILKVLLGMIGYYLVMSLMFSPLLIVEKKLGVFRALKVSFHAFNQHWFKIIMTYLVMTLIYWISVLPLCIGVIWSLPMFMNLNGILYRIMFGVNRDS